MADGVSIEMKGIVEELKLVDKKFASAVRKQIRAAITEAGADIVAIVRVSASWSNRIPAATTMRANFTVKSAGVRIVTNRNRAPHARALEFGNHGGGGGTTFTHPVFGKGTTTQPMRPYFFKSIEKRTPAVERKFLSAIDEATRAAGFR